MAAGVWDGIDKDRVAKALVTAFMSDEYLEALAAVNNAETVADLVGCDSHDVAVCSTGLIGELLPLDNVLNGARNAYAALASTADAGSDAAGRGRGPGMAAGWAR